MSKKIHIKANDIFRVLDTEVLPYEVPVWFSNKLFKKLCSDKQFVIETDKNNKTICIFKELKIKNINSNAIRPLEYSIAQNDDETRQLGIMHPYVQLEVVDFYRKYGDVIPYYCSLSPATLRFPWRVAKSFLTPDDIEDEMIELDGRPERKPVEDTDIPCINFVDSYCSSFYVYKQINFFYKFFESYDFYKLEKKFTKYAQIDVSKCFNSIYTHSMTWAIKGKSFAKLFRSVHNFENDFDNLMQEINYRETHGILIGPEISRIFAEIILQQIDRNIIQKLKNKYNLQYGVDYEYRRYVDDYTIFYNKEIDIDTILLEIRNNLAFYKMYLNESKTQYLNRPFISSISICKIALKEFITDFFNKQTSNKTLDIHIASHANKAILKIKSIIKTYSEVSYKSVSGFILSEFSRKISESIKNKDIDDESKNNIFNNIIIDIDIIFFILSMDCRVRTTDIITRIILEIIKCNLFSSKIQKTILYKKIFDSCRSLLSILSSSQIDRTIEKANILLLLSSIGDDFLIQPDFIQQRIFSEEELKNYFVWMSLMLYCQNKEIYKNIKIKLIKTWKSILLCQSFKIEDTENFLFFVDSISCPFLKDKQKIILMKDLNNRNIIECDDDKKIKKIIREAKATNFFIDWKNHDWLFEMSKRKVYSFPYE